ncbi:MAG: hypothetical protein P4L53_09840, partial [Candidatus Obscuribacterales bacterium]|nr:hypothetical protein [Candidatus Obscuribacterales bacterium]
VMNNPASSGIENNTILVGKVERPWISKGELLGAILSFEGKTETALLHIKQVAGDNPSDRLSNLNIGEELRVKVTIAMDGSVRKLRASEKELVSDQAIVDALNSLPGSAVHAARVVNVASYGVFIDLEEGPAKGKKGLVHNKNMYSGSGMSLKSFGELVPGKEVFVRLAGQARVDERGTLRIDLAFAAKPEEASAV